MNRIFHTLAGLVGARETLRVAVMGLESSGKTVFLTSLANHLAHHDPKKLPLGGLRIVSRGTQLSGAPSPADGTALKVFPYGTARASLANRRWPEATREPAILAMPLDLTRDGNIVRRINLEILDIPGETIADFTMVGKSYREWCSFMAARFGETLGEEGGYGKYLEAVKAVSSSCDGDEAKRLGVLNAYRDFLAAEYDNYVFAVVPSCVHLGRGNGRVDSTEDFRAHLSSVPLGLGRDLEFAPLPVEAFLDSRHPLRSIAKNLSRGYEAYRSAKVEPLAKWFSHAEKLYYLVNVLDILKMGPRRKNAERRFGTAAMEMFARHKTGFLPLDAVVGFLRFFLDTQIDSPRLVATQIDRVHSERNRSNMEDLVRHLFAGGLETLDFPDGTSHVMSCAAVRTTCDSQSGALAYSSSSGVSPEMSSSGYIPSDVPSDWPDSTAWIKSISNKEYNFPDSGNIPFVDLSDDVPPPHIRLERIVQDMLELY